jgi:hypothetical protein
MACNAAEFRSTVKALGAIAVVRSRKNAKDEQPCPAYLSPSQPDRTLLVAPHRMARHRHPMR